LVTVLITCHFVLSFAIAAQGAQRLDSLYTTCVSL
jgi:hypothetical protein